MKRLLLLFVPALLVAAFAVACSDDDDSGGNGGDGSVRIGVLLPLTGDLASYGETSEAALEAARDAINEDSDLEIELVVKDSETDPDVALTRLEELHSEDIKVVVGPYASSEVGAVKDFADSNGIVLLSPLSTAQSLAVPDNIYRFTPDDGKEGEAVAAVALEDGITTVIPLSRDDAGNLGLQAAMKPDFEAGGGTIVEGITYATSGVDFDAVVEDLVALLEEHAGTPDTSAVYLTAFAEVTQLFEAASASDQDILTSVRWYGSDSVALSRDLVSNSTAAAFAVEIGYPNPILGLREEDRSVYEPIVAELSDDLGRTPDAFALAAYDALVVAHMAFEDRGLDAEAEAIGEAIMSIAEGHVGLTGPSVLNEAGDRDSGSYDFWSVCPDGSGFTWTRTISYVPGDGGGTVQRFGC